MGIDVSVREARPSPTYQRALLQLMPRGQAWDTRPDGDSGKLMLACGDSFARVDRDKCQLSSRERYPSSATWLLPDWEACLGLPECAGLSQSIAERQRVAQNKMTFYGSLNRVFYENLAKAYGFDIAITPDPDNSFISKVNVKGGIPYRDANVLDPCTTPLRVYSYSELQCVLERYWPAHQGMTFTFDGE
ncbi:putative phage tail protein [Aeromonas piscicola]|uniref:putative phage tail protein n=1 Tax=Aeromonas piscicola TaxID=600645 RepID=UPI0005B3D535|nr:putative phage tail protein [Aeromonas piscicola]